MSYQDAWINGAVVSSGMRECARRYEIVKGVCASLRSNFTVCDIGANLCYFGLRLAEDFPGAEITAYESHPAAYRRAKELIVANGATRVDLHNKRLRLPDIDGLIRNLKFDVVLAMSVLHHVAGNPADWLRHLEYLGGLVIVEAAGKDSHRKAAQRFVMPSRAVKLGEAPSHLDSARPRSIYLLKGGRSRLWKGSR